MFDNDVFETWLDNQSKEIVEKMGRGEQLRTEEMMILVLKAQSNHFHHLDKDLRNEMQTLRVDMQGEMKTLRMDMQGEMKTLRVDMQDGMKALRQDMRDEIKTLRVDMDRRFEQVMRRMDRFMFWSLGITVAAAAFVVTYLKQ